MKHSAVLAAVVLLFLPMMLAAQKPGEFPRTMYVTFDRAQVYAEADYLSEILDSLKAGDSVTVLGVQKKYYRIEAGGGEGYLLSTNLALTLPKEKKGKGRKNRAEKPADEKKEERKEERVSTAAVDSTATRRGSGKRTANTEQSAQPQCQAITKAGRQCSRRAGDSTVYCWQHRPK